MFLNRVAAHPTLSKSPELQLFLEATEDTWAVEMARGQSVSAGGAAVPKTVLGNTVGFFKGLGAAATSMVGGGGRAADASEDPEYIKVRRRGNITTCYFLSRLALCLYRGGGLAEVRFLQICECPLPLWLQVDF